MVSKAVTEWAVSGHGVCRCGVQAVTEWMRARCGVQAIYDMLDGCKGLTLLVTCAQPVAVPYEHVFNLTPLCHADLATLIRTKGVEGIHSADPITTVLYGLSLGFCASVCCPVCVCV